MNPLAFLTKARTAVALLLPKWQEMHPVYEPNTFENFVKQGYRKNELIYSCIRATARTAASVSLQVYDEVSDEPLAAHPLEMLLRRPNPFMSSYGFWDFTMINLKLAGRMYWEKVRSGGGEVTQLWPLRPDWMSILPSSRDFIGGYKYEVPGADPVTFDPADILAFRYPDPLNIYQSLSPVQLAARVGDVDNATTDFTKLFWERGAMPLGVLSSKLKLTDEAVKSIRQRWAERYGGFAKWFEPAVLDSDATFSRIGLNMQEMQFDALDARNEARICAVLEVPPIIAGAKIGLQFGTYSNYEQARKSWWEDVLTPQYRMLSDQIDAELVPDFGDGIYSDFDMNDVPAFKENQDMKWTRVTTAYTAGILTLNEARTELGFTEMTPDQQDELQPPVPEQLQPFTDGTQDPQDGQDAPPKDMPDMQKADVIPASIATVVPPFTEQEINALFDSFDKMPSLAELRRRMGKKPNA